jgi:DHA1 family purine base/nucleoside efflux pump-like MFS transporter
VRIGPLLALTVATFSLGFGELMIAGILPNVAHDLHVTLAATGALVGVYALTFAVVSPPLAVVMTRVERRTAIIAALLVMAAANGAAAAGGGFAAILVLRAIAAAGSAVATTIALASVDLLADPESRGRAHGIVFAGFSAAATLGVPFGVLIAERWTWRYAFGAVAVSALLAAVLIAYALPRVPRAKPLTWTDLARVIAHRPLQLTIAVSLLNLTATYIVTTYIRPYMDATGHFDPTTVAGLLLLYGAMGIVGNVVTGGLVDRFGSYRTIIACIGGTLAIFLVFGIAMQTLVGAALAMGGWAFAAWGFGPAVNQRLGEDAMAAPEIGLAFNFTAFNAGIALGSTVGGIAIANAGPLSLPFAAAATLAVALGIAWRNPSVAPRAVAVYGDS